MGRKTKLTAELQDEMVRVVRAGNYIETACDYVGIHRVTFHRWMQRGERGWKIDEPFCYFRNAILQARAAAEIESVARIRASARKGNLEDDKFFLTHAYSERWGTQRVKTEVSGPEGEPLTVKVIWDIPRPRDGGDNTESE